MAIRLLNMVAQKHSILVEGYGKSIGNEICQLLQRSEFCAVSAYQILINFIDNPGRSLVPNDCCVSVSCHTVQAQNRKWSAQFFVFFLIPNL